jgi:hypothetical protein
MRMLPQLGSKSLVIAIMTAAALLTNGAWAQQRPAGGSSMTGKKQGPPPFPDLDDETIFKKISSALPEPARAAGSKCDCCGQPLPAGAGAGQGKGGELVVLRMRGEFADGGIDGKCISPFAMKLMLDLCRERKPVAVVLDIDSPGGLASAMDEIIDQVLNAQAEAGLRLVAWPRDAHSAAALTCMSCKEIVVRPLSRIGAATLVQGENAAPAAETAMDHKRESSRQARRRQIAQTTGRDLLILDAMQYPERELWYRDGDGFRNAPQAGEGWMALDDSADAPATLNADELNATGISIGTATGENELKKLLSLPATTPICVIDLSDQQVTAALKPTIDALDRWIAWRNKSIKDFMDAVREKSKRIFDASTKVEALMHSDNGWSDEQQEDVKRKVDNCTFLPALDPNLEKVMEGTAWLACLQDCMKFAKTHADNARNAMKPQKTGSGRIVNLELANSNLIDCYNALIRFLNGCPDE